jgi:hypothetical protein
MSGTGLSPLWTSSSLTAHNNSIRWILSSMSYRKDFNWLAQSQDLSSVAIVVMAFMSNFHRKISYFDLGLRK